MAIIINDFEIIPPSPGNQEPAAAGGQRGQEGETAQTLQPEDIERIVRRFAQRRLRLWAD